MMHTKWHFSTNFIKHRNNTGFRHTFGCGSILFVEESLVVNNEELSKQSLIFNSCFMPLDWLIW